MRWSLPITAAAPLLAGCAVLGGCAGPAGSDALRLSVEQYREDEVAGTIQLRVVNTGVDPVAMEGAQLRWSGLTGGEPVEVATTARPGVAVDVPLPLPPAACGDLGSDLAAELPQPPAVDDAVGVLRIDGERVEVAVVDDAGVLARIWSRDCERQRIAEQVSVTFGREWREVAAAPPQPPSAVGELVIRRLAAPGPVLVQELRGTVIAQLDTAAELPSELPPAADAELRLAVRVQTNGRCTGHVLAEVKKPFDFAVLLRIGTTDVVVAPVRPDALDQPLLRRVVEDGCAIVAPGGAG
jgi:hypothetical protein